MGEVITTPSTPEPIPVNNAPELSEMAVVVADTASVDDDSPEALSAEIL